MSPKTEKEKMVAGESYNFLDPSLDAERSRTKQLYRLFNRTEDPLEQQNILKQLLGHLGRNSVVEPPFYCSYGFNTHLGDNVFLNFQCTILDNAEVRIGEHVMIGPAVQIYTAIHPLEAESRNQGWEVARPVVIENNVWIGGAAILLPGITIGRNSVVGAGAVVTHDVPPNTVFGGNPAKVIKEIMP